VKGEQDSNSRFSESIPFKHGTAGKLLRLLGIEESSSQYQNWVHSLSAGSQQVISSIKEPKIAELYY
jgi:hypothetical protein